MGALLEALWGYMMNQIILEEKNQFTIAEFRAAATALGIDSTGCNKNSLYEIIRKAEGYQKVLRDIL